MRYTQALLELEPLSGRVFPTLCEGENGQPPTQRANVALISAAIKSTRLVANANRPEGTPAFPVSPHHPSKTNQTPILLAIPNQPPPYTGTPLTFPVDWQLYCPCVLVLSVLLVARY